MLQEFKKFILRGNVIDLAVAVVVGGAFNGVVTAMVKDFVTPLIAAIYGHSQFSASYFTIHHSRFLYGDFINAFVSFLITAGVVFFVVVQPINHLISLSRRNSPPADPSTRKCPECLSEIPKQAKRCMFCTSKLVSEK